MNEGNSKEDLIKEILSYLRLRSGRDKRILAPAARGRPLRASRDPPLDSAKQPFGLIHDRES